jgi:pimeloyl-ACP methyl ester carboxylesterase
MKTWGKLAASTFGALGLAAAVAVLTGNSAQPGTSAHAAAPAVSGAPMALARQGYFYAGGHYDDSHPDRHIVGQAYVEYRIPQALKHPFPIVMIHGGGVHGATWLATPDGREGWAQYFVRAGYAVYIVDQVGRGRSPFTPEVYGERSSQSLEYVQQKFTTQEKYKIWPQAALHTQFPGTGQPGDPAFDQYWAGDVPGMENRNLQSQMNIDAVTALLDKIGPSIILVHSQSGVYAWPLAQARPQLVKAIVAAEPNGPPVHDVVVKSVQRFDQPWEKTIKQTEDDWYRDNPGVKRWGLTSTPLKYIPAVTDQSPLQFIQEAAPQARNLSRCWKQKEPARKLVDVGGRPILVLEAEASFYAGYNHCNVQYLQQAGVPVDFIRLADKGIHGTGHMMMLEKNSDSVAQVIVDWMDKNVTPLEKGQTALIAGNSSKPPMLLKTEGNFYAGGEYDRAHPEQHIVWQMYVEYQIPAQQTHPYPILMVHGGGQTGAGWRSTADDREGWAQYFLRRGYAVYIVDQVGRGRSPYDEDVYGETDAQSLSYVVEKFTAQEKFKAWPQAAGHTQWPGTGQRGDPTFDQYWASDAPAMTARVPESTSNVAALAKLLDRIGPVILLVHSQSGTLAWPLAQARPNLVKAIAAAEPSGPPVHQIAVRSSEQRFGVAWEQAWKENDEDFYRDLPRQKKYGLGDAPLNYVPAVTEQSPLVFVQEEKAQAPAFARCWRQKEPARKLTVVGDRPIMILGAPASFYTGYNHCNVQYLEQAGVHVDFVKLADKGIRGNGHMMMFEKNSDAVAQVILDWIEKVMAPIEAQARTQATKPN